MSLGNLNKSSQVIALVDCNNFYASCERVFNPAWQHIPIAVLSNNDGCIIARSNEVKEAGIPMGAPYFQWKSQLQQIQAVVVSSNYTLYGDMSARVMDTLARFTPDMEIYSIDEAWLNLSHIPPLELPAYSAYMVAHTKQSTGIPVSMGISCTKHWRKLPTVCTPRKPKGKHQKTYDRKLAKLKRVRRSANIAVMQQYSGDPQSIEILQDLFCELED